MPNFRMSVEAQCTALRFSPPLLQSSSSESLADDLLYFRATYSSRPQPTPKLQLECKDSFSRAFLPYRFPVTKKMMRARLCAWMMMPRRHFSRLYFAPRSLGLRHFAAGQIPPLLQFGVRLIWIDYYYYIDFISRPKIPRISLEFRHHQFMFSPRLRFDDMHKFPASHLLMSAKVTTRRLIGMIWILMMLSTINAKL